MQSVVTAPCTMAVVVWALTVGARAKKLGKATALDVVIAEAVAHDVRSDGLAAVILYLSVFLDKSFAGPEDCCRNRMSPHRQ